MLFSEAMEDEAVFGGMFQGKSWRAHKVLQKAIDGRQLNRTERRFFLRCSGGREPPTSPPREVWRVDGRRTAKSQLSAARGSHAAAFTDWRSRLSAGETATVGLIASDKAQARIALSYVKAFCSAPLIKPLVMAERADALDLRNGATIEVMSCNSRRIRGRTFVYVLADEVAHWRSETSSDPDVLVYEAAVPATATVDGQIVGTSTPAGRTGLLWDKFARHYGCDGDVLVLRSPTRRLNPNIPQRIIDEAMARDPSAASAEWLGEFRSDLERLFDRQLLDALVRPEPLQLPPRSDSRYFAYVDVSGGRQDRYAWSIGHRESDQVIVDLVDYATPPFDPGSITARCATALREYGVHKIIGDRYAGEWPVAEFRKHQITYQSAAKTTSDTFKELVPVVVQGRVELPPDQRLLGELAQLERRVGPSGREAIGHPSGANMHDDLATCVAGVINIVESTGRLLTDEEFRAACRGAAGPPLASSHPNWGELAYHEPPRVSARASIFDIEDGDGVDFDDMGPF